MKRGNVAYLNVWNCVCLYVSIDAYTWVGRHHSMAEPSVPCILAVLRSSGFPTRTRESAVSLSGLKEEQRKAMGTSK